MVIKFSPNLVMDPVTVAEVKEGLEFGRRVRLPSDLAFSTLHLAQLFANEGHVRPFEHLRLGDMVFMVPLVLKLTCFPVSGICNLSLPHPPFITHAHIPQALC